MKKAGRGSAVDHEPPLATGAIERHLSTAGTVRPRRCSRGVGRDAAFTIPLIRKRRSTLLLDPPMAASRQDYPFPAELLRAVHGRTPRAGMSCSNVGRDAGPVVRIGCPACQLAGVG